MEPWLQSGLPFSRAYRARDRARVLERFCRDKGPSPPSSADALPIQVPEEGAEGVPVRESDAVPASWGVSLVGSLKPGGGHRAAGFAYDDVFGVAQDGLFHHWVEKRLRGAYLTVKCVLDSSH